MMVRFCNTCMEMDESSQELTEHGSALFPIACYEDDLTEGPVPWHWHPELELAVVVKGSAVVAADAQRCTLGEGDDCFINANAIHAAWSADESPCVIHSVVCEEGIGGRYEHSDRLLLPAPRQYKKAVGRNKGNRSVGRAD